MISTQYHGTQLLKRVRNITIAHPNPAWVWIIWRWIMWRRMTVAIARGWWIIATSICSWTWWWWVMPCIRVVRIIGGTTPIGVAVVIPLSALIRIVGLPGCWDTRIGIPLITPICRSVGIWLAARIRHLGGQACENLKLCCTSGLAVFQEIYESFFKIESARPLHW